MPPIAIENLRLSAPDGYTVKMVILTAPMKPSPQSGSRSLHKERSFLRNLVLAKEDVDEATVLEDYAARQIDILAQQVPGFKRVREGSVMIGGVPSPIVESTGSGPEGLALTTITAFAQRGRTIWTISASNLSGIQFMDTREEYYGIIQSLELPQ